MEKEIDKVQKDNDKEEKTHIKMDYSLETSQERNEKVKEILFNTEYENLSLDYLEKLTDYIVEPLTKKEKKIENKSILTTNRLKTVNAREISFEGLVGKLENGEDGIYSMIANDKNIIFKHKIGITQQDLDEIPPLKELCEAIDEVKKMTKHTTGKRAYNIRQQLFEMYKDQYIIKDCFKKPKKSRNQINIMKSMPKLDLDENIIIENGEVKSDGLINFYDPNHISLLLCYYSKLKEDSWDKFQSDIKWMLEDLENLIDKTLKDNYPMYYDLVIYKIDGKQNKEIQELLYKDYGIKHSVEYISSLWRKKIPKMITTTAINDYLIWHYTYKEKGKWKRCSRCGQIKLAHNNFFSKNSTSKDGWYSICKECRNKKNKQQKKIK